MRVRLIGRCACWRICERAMRRISRLRESGSAWPRFRYTLDSDACCSTEKAGTAYRWRRCWRRLHGCGHCFCLSATPAFLESGPSFFVTPSRRNQISSSICTPGISPAADGSIRSSAVAGVFTVRPLGRRARSPSSSWESRGERGYSRGHQAPEPEAIRRCLLAGFSDHLARCIDRATLRCRIMHGQRGRFADRVSCATLPS